ncbi:hypothetical protein D3C87_477210 [compost metagenome]
MLGVGQADGRGLLPFLTQGALQVPVAQFVFLHHEQAGVLGRAGGQEALLADRGEVALAQLQTDHALEAGDLAMLGLDAAVVALIGEGGRDDAFFQFLMLIVGVTGAQADVLDAGQRIAQFAPQVEAAALQPDLGHAVVVIVLLAFLVIMVVVVVIIVTAAVQVVAVRVAALILMGVAGQTIAAGLLGVGRAQIAASADV